MAGSLTRINNNQISTASAGNAQLGINAGNKVQVYTITGGLLANSLTYGSDLTVTGNLTVNGTTTAVNTVNTLITDPLIVLADGQTSGTPTVDIGTIGLRGNQNAAVMAWKESAKQFVAALSNTDAGGSSYSNTTFNINSYADFQANTITANSNLNVSGTTSLTGNITSALNVTGTITGGNLATPGTVSATGTITGANITGSNLLTGGIVSSTGNATHGNLLITGSGIISTAGNIYGANLIISGNESDTGNIQAGNLLTGGQVSATGNITGGNILFGTGIVSGTGNISAGYFIGNGSQLTGVTASSVNANSLTGTTLNSGVVTSSLTSVGVLTSLSVSGNITAGNVSATNHTGTNVSVTGTATAASTVGGVITGSSSSVTGTQTAASTVGGVITGSSASVTGAISGASASVSGGVTAASVAGGVITGSSSSVTGTQTAASTVGGVITGSSVSVTGNVSATSLNANTVYNSTSVTITAASGTITLNPSGNVLMSSKNINNLADPTQPQDAATKNYVDTVVQGLDVKASCLVATVGNLATATGGTVTYNNGTAGVGATLTTTGVYNLIDGGNVQTVGSRILVKNEANAAWNGIYTYTSTTVITRSTDFDNEGTNGQIPGAFTFIETGTVNDNTGWTCTTNNPVVMGTTAITWAQFSGAGSYTANTSAGISLTGTIFSALVDNNTTAFDGNGNIIVKASAQLTTPNIGAATGTSLSVTGTVTSSSVVGGVMTGTSLSTTGNVTGGNILFGTGIVSGTGNISAGYFIGNGSQLTGVTATSVNANSLTGTTLNSGVVTSSLTSVGVLTSLSVSGNITAGNVSATNHTGTNVSVTGTATAASTVGGVITGSSSSVTGTQTAASTVGGVITGSSSSVTGTQSAASTVGGVITGSSSSVTGTVTAASTVGGIITGSSASVTGTVTAASTVGGVITGSSVSVTGNVTGGNLISTGFVQSANGLESTSTYPGPYTDGIVVDYLTGNGRISTGAADGLIIYNGGVANTALVTISNVGALTLNGSGANATFTTGGNANIGNATFFVNQATGTASFGNATQTTNALVAFNSTTSILIPVGNTAQKPGPGVTGMMRFNTTNNSVEIYNNSGWSNVGQQTFTVIADETFTGNGVATTYTLANPGQTTNGVIVSINGIVQAPTTAYAVSGASGNVLTFTEAPAVGDNIDVREFTTTTTVTSIAGTGSSVFAGTNEVDITGNLIPTSNATQSLGNATNTWSSLYVSGTTIYLGPLQLKASGTTFSVYQSDGTTLANVGAAGLSVTSITDGTSAFQFSGVNGNAIMTAGGANTIIATSTGANVAGYATASGNITGGNVLTGGLVSAAGNITGTSHLGTSVSVTGAVTAASVVGGVITGSSASVSGTQTAASTVGGVITGSSSSVTGTQTAASTVGGVITGSSSSVTGTQSAASTVGGVITGSSTSVTGSSSAGSFSTAGAVTAASVVGGVITGSSTSVTGTQTAASTVGGVITGSSASVTGTLTGASTVGGVITGSSASVSGTVTGASVVGGSITLSSNTIVSAGATLTIDPNGAGGTDGNVVIAGNLTVQGTTTTINSTTVTTNDLVYQLANNASTSTAANGSGLAVGPVGAEYAKWLYNNVANTWTTGLGISATGTVTGGNLLTSGAISTSGTVTAASVSGGVITGSSASVSGGVTAASVSGGVITGSSVSVTGTVTNSGETVSGTITVNSSNNATAIANGGTNGGGNIGASGATFNTVFAKATTAQYADLAEKYTADAKYAPGTVLVFGGTAEVTVNAVDGDRRVAGVVSTDPGFLMNEGLDTEFAVAIALTGRVPCMVVGPVRKGDLMVAAGLGRARAEADPRVGTVIGKALEDFDGAEGTIEVVVGRF